MFTTNISDYKGFTRTIDLLKQDTDTTTRIVVSTCLVKHFLEGVEIPDLTKICVFYNDNKASIPTGEIDEEGNSILIGDYDIVVEQLEAGVPYSTVFANMMAYADSVGLINAKANYKF